MAINTGQIYLFIEYMKKAKIIALFLVSIIATVLITWFLTKTHYKIQYFEVAKENFVFRELQLCKDYYIPEGSLDEIETSQV